MGQLLEKASFFRVSTYGFQKHHFTEMGILQLHFAYPNRTCDMLQLHFAYRNCTDACFQVNCPSCRFVCLQGFFSHFVYLIWVLRPPSCWAKILLSNEVKNQQKSCKKRYICNCTCNMSPLQNFERKYHF